RLEEEGAGPAEGSSYARCSRLVTRFASGADRCIIVLIHIGTSAHARMFILNPQSGVPIYRQIQEQVRRMVASGQLQPGATLPSVRELATRHAVNPMTISKAYTLLEAEGLLERNRGKPMTVADRRRAQAPVSKRLQQ